MKLLGKVAIITGAARGIGLAIAEKYAGEGCDVVIADIDAKLASEAAILISEKYNVKAIPFGIDVAVKEENDQLIKTTLEAFGRLDILVLNAGVVNKAIPIEEISVERWERVLGINLMSQIHATAAFVPYIKKGNEGGRIIYMASIAGEVGGVAAEATYSISKAGSLCLNKVVAKQLAPYGVTVNAIAPGTIQTNMTEVLEYSSAVLDSIPLKRIGAVDDIANAALYLASDEAKYITGTVIDVNGGLYMR